MAYMNQETKKALAVNIKAVLKKFGMKASIGVRHHSTLVVNIKSGKLDIINNYWNLILESRQHGVKDYAGDTKPTNIQVNEYWIKDNYTGEVREFLLELKAAMEGPEFFNHDDIQSDYFHRSHYIDINVGRWDTPYILES